MKPDQAVEPQTSQLDPLDARSAKAIRLAGFAALGLCLAVTSLADSDRLGEGAFDLYQRIMPRSVERFPTRIVEIDEASLTRYGPWPWPRSRLAELAQAAFDGGALAIGFDMIFPEPDRQGAAHLSRSYPKLSGELKTALSKLPDPDDVFAGTIGRLPVVLGRSGVPDEMLATSAGVKGAPIEAVFSGDPPPGSLLSYPAELSNLEMLDRAAAGHGLLNAPPDKSGTLRRVPLVALVAGRPVPSIALEVLRVAIGADGYTLEAKDGALLAVVLGDRRIVTEPDGRLRPYFSPPLTGRTISAARLLDKTLEDGIFRNSVVIIGAAAIGVQDIIATPLAAASSGADVHAQTIEAIVSGTWLTRPLWAPRAEWVLSVFLAVLLIGALPRTSPALAIAISISAVVVIVIASVAVFATQGMLLDAVTPSIVFGVPAATVCGGLSLDAERRRRGLRAALVEERVSAARVSGELAAARDIQLALLPDRDELNRLPEAVEVAAAIHPARMVGGDFYDAFLLDPQRLFFMIGDVAGKGLPASLFMALSKALISSAVIRTSGDLDLAVRETITEISRENRAEMFMAGVLGVLDLGTGHMALCNAGHENPMVLRADGSLSALAMDGGPPLCVVKDFAYPIEAASLGIDDVLLMVSDGVTDASAPDGERFGRARLLKVLGQLSRPAGAAAAVKAVASAARAFEAEAEPADDLTVLAVRFRGSQ
jgi:serine phosphatase RsbU (regulator of sigma subunit)